MTEHKIDIAQQLDKLIKLQEVDTVIYRLKSEISKKPIDIENLKQLAEQEKKAADEAANALKQLQLKRKEKEVDLDSKEGQIRKLNTQLYQLKTNKEYDAMQHEINGVKADCSVLEEEILKLMDDIDKSEASLSNKKSALEEKQQQINNQIREIESQIKLLKDSLTQEQEKRKQAIIDIDPRILSNYDKILKAKDGAAMAPVMEDACGSCFMHLPPQVINEIKLKNDIIYCQICSRILYDKGE